MANPFNYGSMVTDPARFFGRRQELRDIFSRLGTVPAQPVSIVGSRRIGKSSLLYHLQFAYQERLSASERYIITYRDMTEAHCHTREGFLATLLADILSRAQISPEYDETHVSVEVMNQVFGKRRCDLVTCEDTLRSLTMHPGARLRLIACLDEFESLVRRPQEFDDDFWDALRAWMNAGLIAFVTASKRPLHELCAEQKLTSPFFNVFAQVELDRLTESEARALVTQPHDRPFTEQDVKLALELGDRHPHRLQMACAFIYEAREGLPSNTPAPRRQVRRWFSREVKRFQPSRRPRRIRWLRPFAALGALALRTGQATDELKNAGVGILIVVIVILALVGLIPWQKLGEWLSRLW